MNPPHKRFFTSLKQLEKRLKLDDGNPPPPAPPPPPLSPPPLPPPQTETQPTDSSCNSPLYIHNHHTNTSSTLHTNSIEQPPPEFLSINNTNPNKNPIQSNDSEPNFPQNNPIGDIDAMIQILRLSDFEGKGPETPDVAGDEFYEKIVKVKGPKCKREVERLDGWINYLMNSGGKEKEPFRLAHLLLAKAAFVSAGGSGGDGGDGEGLEFPSTVDEFLQNDPPTGLINLELN